MVDLETLLDTLTDFFADHPHIDKVYLLADGSYVLNAFEFKGQLYSRIDPNASRVADPAPLQDPYKIAETVTREDLKQLQEKNSAGSQTSAATPAPVAPAPEAKNAPEEPKA